MNEKKEILKGKILKSTGRWYNVLSNGKIYKCIIRGKLKTQGYKSTNPIAVGDNVEFYLQNDNTGVIQNIIDRKNCIVRQATNLSKKTHLLACNIDQAIIVVSLKAPETPTEFIDRFLVSTEVYNIPAKIIFNKIDIYQEQEKIKLQELSETYEKIGYKCYHISATNKTNLDQIIELLKNKTSALAGNSGVGKSTIINAISPNLNLKTENISDKHQTGKHTTTFAEMYQLQFGGFIIDTPGIRAFGTNFIDKKLIAQNFPEMFNLLGKCKYYNCLHIDEPGCAVKEAFENGQIAFSRYKSYLSMMLENDDKYRIDPFT
jgi:ribosome biogenesis GTPase